MAFGGEDEISDSLVSPEREIKVNLAIWTDGHEGNLNLSTRQPA